jgi:hypothetical protein
MMMPRRNRNVYKRRRNGAGRRANKNRTQKDAPLTPLVCHPMKRGL